MKKYIYTIVVIFLFVSCENEIPFDIKDNPPKLIINALFDADKEKNEIYLALTGREKVTYIRDASVDIYINGELKEHLIAPYPEPDQHGFANVVHKTKVRFSPGDVIKLEARTDDGKYHAWSEVTVPRPIEIEKIDTTMVSRNLWWNNGDRFLRTKTTFTDDGQRTNYYRITMSLNLEIEAMSPVTGNDTIHYTKIPESLIINEDVVLTDGRPSLEDDDNGPITPVQNAFGVFDNSRINGTYTMTTSIKIPYSYLDYMDYNQYQGVKRIGIKVKVRLLSISKMQYFYLRALNTYDSIDYDDYFNPPIKFPSNIEGGTGIFGVSMGNEVIIQLKDFIPTRW